MFNISMDPTRHNIGEEATCTTCTFAEDFSNYWTATLFFRARNGSYIRVPQRPNVDFDGARGGGMTVYYTASCEPFPFHCHPLRCFALPHHASYLDKEPSLKDQANPFFPLSPQTKTKKSPPSSPASA